MRATETNLNLPTHKGHGLKNAKSMIIIFHHHKLDNYILELRYNKNRRLTNIKAQVIGQVCLRENLFQQRGFH